MEKLADGLQKLQEDDLLLVVQMVHDGKDPNTYTKNDVESECFILKRAIWHGSSRMQSLILT